jgi:hypothetical protein
MNRRPRPIVFVRVDNALVPLPRFMKLFDETIAVGEEVPMDRVEDRSMASHGGYFAAVHEGWKNLAEEFDGRFPDAEYLRKWALVESGYCAEANFVMDTAKDAHALGVALRQRDKYAVIRVSGNVVKVFTAESQSMASMKKERFESSKRAVLDLIASMARTTPAELKKNAGRSA